MKAFQPYEIAVLLSSLLVIYIGCWCRFPDPQHIAGQMVSFQDVDFNYPGGPQLFSKLDFGLDMESRLAMVGANGMLAGLLHSSSSCVSLT